MVLGMTFNWGVFLGWSVNTGGTLDLAAALPFYVAGICWTLFYDTIYAHQDKHDDQQLGLKSTALKFGDQTALYLYCFSTLMTLSLLLGGFQTEQTWPYYLAVAGSSYSLLNITKHLDINCVDSCAKAFKRNSHIGWLILSGIVLSTLVKSDDNHQLDLQPPTNTPALL